MKNFLKQHWRLILIFIGILVLSHLEGNLAMIIGEATFLWAAILVLKTAIWSCSWLIRHSPEKITRIRTSGFRFIYMAVLCAVSWQGIPYIHAKITRDFAPLIASLDAYKTQHGDYPKTQEAFENLTPRLPNCGIMPFDYVEHSSDGKIYA